MFGSSDNMPNKKKMDIYLNIYVYSKYIILYECVCVPDLPLTVRFINTV